MLGATYRNDKAAGLIKLESQRLVIRNGISRWLLYLDLATTQHLCVKVDSH
jgi:hypothetical protein